MTKVIYHEPEPGLFLVKVIVDDPRHPDDIRLAPKTRIHLVGTANARRVALCTVNDPAHYPTEGWRIELNDARAPTRVPVAYHEWRVLTRLPERVRVLT